MKIRAFWFALTVLCGSNILSQQIPEGYLLQYQQSFNDNKALNEFEYNKTDIWGIHKNKNNLYLQCGPVKNDSIFPANRAILKNRIFGDFIMELDVTSDTIHQTTGEICVFLGYTDSTRYYYIQLGNSVIGNDHGIYVVKKSIRTRLTGETEQMVNCADNKWHKLRVQRNIVKRTILVFADDTSLPILQIKDYELVMGSIGIGSFSGQCKFDNIKIWSPTVISED